MAKYKNTCVYKKVNGDYYSNDNINRIISSHSVLSNNLENNKIIGNGSIGIVKFTDNFLSSADPTFDGQPVKCKSIDSSTIKEGANVKNMHASSCSCMLMHANPKLTGNVKVVVDSKSNMYIDTFKVNDAMSKRKYRHVPISYKDYYGNNIMAVFRDVTSNDFYDIPEKYRRLFTVSHNYTDQYVYTYRFGASTNRDNLYKESMSILAPLKIGKILPDFFVIFRVKGSVDEKLSSTDTLKYMINNGVQVKFFDFREGTELGTYIRTIYEHSKNFIGYVYDSREEQNTNIFNGISIDRGVATSAHESTAFSPDIDASLFKYTPQAKIDDYYTSGYERNRLVAPDMVNFEFMFNDDTDQFSIDTYFGLYITENDIREGFYIKDASNGEISFSDDTKYGRPKFSNNIIHAYTSSDDFIRTCADDEYDKLKDLKNRYGNNVLSLPMKEMDEDMSQFKSYISFTLNEAINKGEHLRIICNNTNTDRLIDVPSSIYEVIISNNDDYIKNKYHISEDSITYKKYIYNDPTLNQRIIEIHRIAVSIGETLDSIKDILETYKRSDSEVVDYSELLRRYESDAIYHAFRSFDNAVFEAISENNGTISIGIYDNEESEKYNEYDFQRITDNVVYNTGNEDKLKDVDNEYASKITYFGNNVVELFTINPLNKESVLYSKENAGECLVYTPLNYEILGPRQTNIVKFIDINGTKLYELNPIELSEHILHDQLVVVADNEVINYTPFVFVKKIITKENEVEKLNDVSTNVNIISSMYRTNLMMIKGYGNEDKTYINLYEPYLLSESICGILPIKDYDIKKVVPNNSDTDIIEFKYVNESTSQGYNFDSSNDKSFYDYLSNIYKKGIRNSSGSFVTPSIVKWVSNSSNYDKETNEFTQYVLSKYRDYEDGSVKPYQKIDMSEYVGDLTTRDALLQGVITIEDIISDPSESYIITDSIDDNTLRFMTCGVVKEIVIEDSTSIKLSNYKNFNIYFAESPYSENIKDIELYIDTINKDILIVIYNQDSSVYSYNTGLTSSYKEIQTVYTESDIHITKDNEIKLGGKKINDGVILYTNNLQLSKQDYGLLLYTRYGYNYNSDSSINAFTLKPTDFELSLASSNERVIAYVPDDPSVDYSSLINVTDIYSSCATYIKDTEEGYQNYTIEVNTSLRNMDSSDSATVGYIKAWFSPKLYDLVTFNKTLDSFRSNQLDESIIDVLTNPLSLNIITDKVEETVPMYYNKVSSVNDYSVYKDASTNTERYRISIGRNYEYKTLTNCFAKNYNKTTTPSLMEIEQSTEAPPSLMESKDSIVYRVGQKPEQDIPSERGVEKDAITNVGGYTTGKLSKTYLNSLVLNTRKNDIPSITIKIWNGVSVIKGKIYFNITNALINHIMSMKGYAKSWSYYKDSRYTDMKKFIKDSILPYLNIGNKNELNIYFQKGTKTTGSAVKLARGKKIDNVKREIITQNGDYYVVLTPDPHKIGSYYIDYKITQ